MFNATIRLISDEIVTMDKVRNISLTSSRMILVDDKGVQMGFIPGTIEAMTIINQNAFAVHGMNEE